MYIDMVDGEIACYTPWIHIMTTQLLQHFTVLLGIDKNCKLTFTFPVNGSWNFLNGTSNEISTSHGSWNFSEWYKQ
jgi:hypothetical protein